MFVFWLCFFSQGKLKYYHLKGHVAKEVKVPHENRDPQLLGMGRKGCKACRAVYCSNSKQKWVQYVEAFGLLLARSGEDRWQMYKLLKVQSMKFFKVGVYWACPVFCTENLIKLQSRVLSSPLT